jgi:phosphatidylserine/phosphatidylglycerophosphate/cardiolipin synthase-like enzyme
VIWIGVVVAALSIARPHLRRVLDLEHSRLTVSTGLAKASSGAQGEERFSPWDDIEQLDVTELRQAELAVDVAMYSFTDRRLADALKEIALLGVKKIRIYRDQTEYQQEEENALRFHEPSTTQMFRGRANIQARVKRSPERVLMHLKSFAVDRRLVRDGSANWSLGALRQGNNAHYATDPKNISRFEKAFEAMWARPTNLVIQ